MRKIILFAAHEVGLRLVRGIAADPAVLAVVIHPSDPGGRNAEIAAACTVDAKPCLIWDGGPLSAALDYMRVNSPDLFILAWWPVRLSPETLNLPKLGTLNLHPSFLPWGRGKHSTFYALRDGEPFGVTIHWAVERLDAGDIAWQRQIRIDPEDTSTTLITAARESVIELFLECWPTIKDGEIPRNPNPLLRGSYHDSTEIEEASRIQLDQCYSGRQFLNLLRARTCPPHPASWFEQDGHRYEVRVEINPLPNLEP